MWKLEAKRKNRSKQYEMENGSWWGKTQFTILFYNSNGGKKVNTQKGNSQLPITVKMGFSETFLFSKITFQKNKTLKSLDN